MKDNQSRNLRTSDKPHWLRKLLRMAKVFSAKKPGPLCAVTYKRTSFNATTFTTKQLNETSTLNSKLNNYFLKTNTISTRTNQTFLNP